MSCKIFFLNLRQNVWEGEPRYTPTKGSKELESLLSFLTDIMIGIKYNTVNFLEVTTYIRVIPQGTVDNNLEPDRLASLKALNRSQLLQTTNPLISRHLSGSPNCAWY